MILKRLNLFAIDSIYIVLFWFIAYQLLTYISSIVLYQLFGVYILDRFPTYLEIIDCVIYIALLSLFYGVYNKISSPFRFYFINENGKVRHLIWAVLIAFLFRLSIDPIMRIDEILSGNIESIFRAYDLSKVQLFLKFFNIVILLPILEELFYRGMIFKFLGRNSIVKFMFISSVLFSIGHVNFYPFGFDISNLVIVFLFGLILSFVHLAFGLGYCVLIHVLYNLLWYCDAFFTNIYKDAILELDFGIGYLVIIGFSITGLTYLLVKLGQENLVRLKGLMEK